MSEKRIYKLNGILVGDDRVEDLYRDIENGGLDPKFEADAKDAEIKVGNLEVGTKLSGLSLKKILEMMLYGEQNPTLTGPSLKIECEENLYDLVGKEFSTKGKITFDRGSISPKYETKGYRSGLPTSYVIGSETVKSDLLECDFEYYCKSLQPGANTLNIKVNYSEGEQPLTSHMNNFDAPLPAGSVEGVLTVIGITPAFSGSTEGTTSEVSIPEENIPVKSLDYTKQGLVESPEEGIIGYQLTTPEATSLTDAQEILLPADIKLKGIQAYDVILNQWTWFQGETAEETLTSGAFIEGATEKKVFDGVEVLYKKYIYNVEDFGPRGENYFRFLFE